MLVVGAGPAGLTAARDLARAGANVIVADERLHAGGQYFKPLAPSQVIERRKLDRQFRAGLALHEEALRAGVHILNETTVWAAFSPTEVAAIVAGRSTLFRPKRLILATGAYEQSLPVPGWTLPGVMTVGALQTLARSYRVAPGERIVIAGNGPLCLQTAAELLDGGANVVAVLEAASHPSLLADLPELMQAAWNDPAAAGPGRRPGVAIEAGPALAPARDASAGRRPRATGRGGRSRHRCRHRGAGLRLHLLERARALAGLRPSLRRARQRLDGDGDRRRRPHQRGRGLRDRRRRALRRCAGGDGGRARSRPRRSPATSGWRRRRPQRARRRLARAERFQQALWRLFEGAPLQAGALDASALVCRCEEVTASELRGLVRAGHNTPAALKRATRVGMGRCQGRYCAPVLARMCSGEPGEFDFFAPRPPAKPVPIRALAVEQPEWLGHTDFVPPDMARPRETEPLPRETVDTLVIGGGVAGSCAAYWLAHEGIDTLVVERDDMNLQASGANAGSLHVQLLAFDFVAGAPPAGNRAADTLPLGPASVKLWQEIQRDTGEDLEIKVTGGLMLGESERDIEFLKGKIALEKSRGIEAELIGANELRRMEPCIGESAIAAEWCPGEGKINPLRGTYAVITRAKKLGARFRRGTDVHGDRARGQRLEGDAPAAARSAAGASSTRPARGRRRSRRWRASPSRCAARRCR